MARQGNSQAVGLGWAYRKKRQAAINAMPGGTPCPLCGRPMFKTQKLHFDHIVPRALGGADGPCQVAHAACNMRAGQRLRAQLYRGRTAPRRAAYNRW